MAEKIEDVLIIEGINAKGYGTIPKLVMQDRRLTPEAKAIYSYFKSYAGAGSTAFPKVKKIMYDLCMSEKRYYSHYNLLLKFGYLKTMQIKEGNKYSHNVYTLVENPKTLTDTELQDIKDKKKKPTSQNGSTTNTTSQIDSTQNESSQIESSQNEGYNNNSFKNNSIYNNQSVSQLTDIINNCEFECYNSEDVKNILEPIITQMFYAERIKVNGVELPQSIIRSQLAKLNIDIIDSVKNKIKDIPGTVTNRTGYIGAMLYNEIHEYNSRVLR